MSSRPSRAARATLIIVSDRAARGERADETAPQLVELLATGSIEVPARAVLVPDERPRIRSAILAAALESELVLTSGGTGIGPRDVTPEATRDLLEREIPGLPEAMRAASRGATPTADLSRALAGTIRKALVVNLPGSPKGARECLAAILPQLSHALRLLAGSVEDCGQELAESPPPAEGDR